MSLLTIATLRAGLKPDQRLIGIDPGTKTVGIALSDVSLTLASPHSQLKRGKLGPIAEEILRIAHKENAGGLVVGLPLEMDGSFGPMAQATRDWTHALSAATSLPACQWDERLSSAAVNRFLISEADATRQQRSERVDQMAAAYMLQAALDASRPT